MALQMVYSVNGADLPAAYIRVDSVRGSKHAGWNASVGVYASAAAAVGMPPLTRLDRYVEYDAAQLNPFALTYAALKADDIFAGAEDV